MNYNSFGVSPCPLVAVIDSDTAARRGLELLLTSTLGWAFAGAATDCDTGLALVQERHPDLVVVDISIDRHKGFQLLRQLRDHPTNLKLIAFTAMPSILAEGRSRDCGADGFISKSSDENHIKSCLRAVAAGETFYSHPVSYRHRRSNQAPGVSNPSSSTLGFSNTEATVFTMIGQGLSARQIAKSLFRSIKTIDTHRASIARKLGVISSRQVYQAAFQESILDARIHC